MHVKLSNIQYQIVQLAFNTRKNVQVYVFSNIMKCYETLLTTNLLPPLLLNLYDYWNEL